MSKIESHRDLIVWQKAMDLAVMAYALSAKFPRTEIYRLTDQLTRAAISVPANIAEGHERSTARDYAHFLSIAKGSLMEAETFLTLAVRLRYASAEAVAAAQALIIEISKMLAALRQRLLTRR